MRRFDDILCVVRPDETSGPALARAVALAGSTQAGLTVVQVIGPVAAVIGVTADPRHGAWRGDTFGTRELRRHHEVRRQALMQEVLGRLGKEAGDFLKTRVELVKRPVSPGIRAVARRLQADLIVMGTVARTGVAGLLMGNTAETILNQIGGSVLATTLPGFAAPAQAAE